MSHKERDDTRELLEQLERSARNQETDERPEDVFSDRNTFGNASDKDETLAEFDSYMAQLLGGLVNEDEPKSRPIRKKTAEARNEKQADQEAFSLSYDDAEEFELNEIEHEESEVRDEQEPDEILENGIPENERPEDDVPEEAIPVPDMRVELSDDAITFDDEDDEADGQDEADEDEPETGDEQLTLTDEMMSSDVQIPDQAEASDREEIPEWQDGAATEPTEPTEPTEQGFDEPTEVRADRPAYEFSDETDEDDEIVEQENVVEEPPVATPSTTADDSRQPDRTVEEETIAPIVLEKGDVLLDAEEELPTTEQDKPQEKTEPTEKQETVDKPDTPVPVASPLDAIKAEVPKPKQSPLDAMAAKTQGNVSVVGSPFGNRQKNERTLTDEDVELLLDLGYDANLTQKVGGQRVEAVRYRRQEDERTRRRLSRAYGCSGEEYSSHTQDKQIRSAYRSHAKIAVARLVVSIFFSLMLLACDMIPLIGGEWIRSLGLSSSTGVFGTIGVLLLLLSALMFWPQLLRGWRALLHLTPVPASIPAVLLPLTLLYDVAVFPSIAEDVLLNFPMGVSLVLLAIAELMTVQQESTAFEVVSAHSRKIVMEPIPPRKKKVARNGHIVKIINDEGGRRAWRVHPTDQVTGYFRRNVASTARYRFLSTLMFVSATMTVLVGCVMLAVTGSFGQMAIAVLLTAQLTMPAAAVLAYAYPMLLAARRLAVQGCAIVGQRSVDEYAGEKTLVFDDTEMFRSKSSTEITIKGSGDTKKYIRYAKRLFSTLGGTLRGISTSDLTSETYEERVEILHIYDQGVEARIDGKVVVMAGTSAHMVKHGIRVPNESAELLVRRNVESCILYLAFDGKLRLGYEVDYRISGRFEQVVEELASAGTAIAIETCDPSIHEDFLVRSRKVGSTPVAVVKPVRFERRRDSAVCDSGVIATRSARDIAQATDACDRLMENDKQLRLFQLIASLCGAALSAVLMLFGFVAESGTLIVALLQLLWCLPTVMLTRKNLMNEQRAENENVNRNRE